MSEQQNHHCILSIDEDNWSILAVHGHQIIVHSMSCGCVAVFDFCSCTPEQMESYAKRCVQLDYLRAAGWQGETMQ